MSQQITLYLVRHGQSENNVQGILNSMGGKDQYALTPLGRDQIQTVAHDLVSEHPDVLYSSPIRRTKETAEIISQATGLPIVFDERLAEAGFGEFDGSLQKEFLQKYPDPAMRLSTDPSDGVESFLDLRGRLTKFLQDIWQRHPGQKVVIVSHGDPLEQLHGILLRESPGISTRGWSPKQGTWIKIVWEGR